MQLLVGSVLFGMKHATLFLASDEGAFVNCHDLVGGGGRIWHFYERPPT